MNRIIRFAWILCLVCGSLLTACATEDSGAEKMLVFQKFIQATGAEAQFKQMMDVITAQAGNRFASRLRQQYQMFDDIIPEKQAQIKGLMKDSRKSSTYPWVCLRFSQTLLHQDAGTSLP